MFSFKKVSWVLAGIFFMLNVLSPAQAADLTPAPEYRLSKYDVISVVIIGLDEESFKDILIGPDGYINLPFSGAVKLAGLTIPEATALLTGKMGEYIKIPGMSIMVKQYGQRKVYVMGEVKNPGLYSLGPDYMNVYAALSSAGGIAPKGRTKKIAVVRVVDGKVNLQEVDMMKFMKEQDISQNVALRDGDMIYVPKSNKIDIYTDILPILSTYGIVKSITD